MARTRKKRRSWRAISSLTPLSDAQVPLRHG
jgi:hypothetical protein